MFINVNEFKVEGFVKLFASLVNILFEWMDTSEFVIKFVNNQVQVIWFLY